VENPPPVGRLTVRDGWFMGRMVCCMREGRSLREPTVARARPRRVVQRFLFSGLCCGAAVLRILRSTHALARTEQRCVGPLVTAFAIVHLGKGQRRVGEPAELDFSKQTRIRKLQRGRASGRRSSIIVTAGVAFLLSLVGDGNVWSTAPLGRPSPTHLFSTRVAAVVLVSLVTADGRRLFTAS